jgi:hypothetical protein
MLTSFLFFAVAFPGGAADAPGQDFEARVDIAIERGVRYLRQQMEKEPWSGRGGDEHIMGRTAIEVYALIKSDVSVYDPLVSKALDSLYDLKPMRTYSVALYLMALDAALSQIETDLALVRGRPDEPVQLSRAASGKILRRMQEMTEWLLSMRREGAGVWDYAKSGPRYDNSNTQFAVLALGVAAKRRLKVPLEVWEEIVNHFLTKQEPDGPKVDINVSFRRADPAPSKGKTTTGGKQHVGEEKPPVVKARGWGYQDTGAALTMTSAGLSSLILAREYLFRNKQYPVAQRQRINQAIWDGTAWLARSGLGYGPWFYYALYSVEKVGDLGAMEKIGDIDWYRHGADLILQSQLQDGGWAKGEDHDRNHRYQTSFALLFLNRATDLLVHSRPLFLVTGKGSGGGGQTQEGWVYVGRLRGEVSLRRVFRKLKYNPQASILRIGDDIVKDAIGLARGHELIPHLIDLFASPYKQIDAFARRSLEQITDEKYENPKEYLEWAKTWNSVSEAGRKRDQGSVGRLRELLRDRKSLALKRHVLWALEQIRAFEAVGDVINELENENPECRARAYSALKFITFKDLPFDPNGPEAVRKEQIAAWRAWFEQNPSKPPAPGK